MSSKSPRFRSESSHSETKEERQRSRERASRTPSNRNGKSSSPDIPDAPKIEVRTADQGVVLKSRQLDQFLKSVRGEHVSRKQRQELLDQLPRVQHLAAVAPFVDTALASSNTNQSAVVPVKALVDNHRLFMAIANQAAIASAGIEKGASLSKITPYLDWISKIASWGIQEATAARRMAAIASATRKDPQLVMPNLKVAPLAVEESMSTSAGEMGVPLFGSALLKEAREKAGDSDFGQVIRKLEKRSREGSRPSRAQSSRYSQSFRSRYDSLLDQVYDSSPSSKRPSFVAIKSACQAGRLADFVQNWAQLTSDKWILSTIQGYKLEFSRRPSRSVHVSNARKFSLCQQNAILDEIASLLDKRAIVKVKDGANLWFSNVFLVPKKDGGNRPVINLRPLNKFIRARHFKMESISMLRSLLLPDDWLAKLDMKDAYFGVPIAASDRKWLCFKFNGSTYQFRALPFGLSSAPYVYSKVMRVVATHLRQLGLRLIVYLDDWLFLNESKKGLVQDLKVVRSVFAHLGLIINEEKSSQTPSRTLEFLGFIVNASAMTLTIPDAKIQKIREKAWRLMHATCSLRDLAEFLGRLSACNVACYFSKLMARRLQRSLHRKANKRGSSIDYDAPCSLTEDELADVRWWYDNVRSERTRKLLEAPVSLKIQTDASTRGWGAVCGLISTGGRWSIEESRLHINILELKAILFGLKIFASASSNITVLIESDSAVAIAYINRFGGTRSGSLLELSRSIWNWARGRNIFLCAAHIPGVENVVADRESRVFLDKDDWTLDKRITRVIFECCGFPAIDLFATRLSRQCERFISYRPDPYAEAVDAFAHSWNYGLAYAFPPFCLIGRVLRKAQQDGSPLLLITPFWPSQFYWPILLRYTHYPPIILPKTSRFLVNAAGEDHPLSYRTDFRLVLWRIYRMSGGLLGFPKEQRKRYLTLGRRPLEANTIHQLKDFLTGVSVNR
ncbi:hypothetical protein QR680_017417 [Steinernema hermaphroditum]|uniref:Reverse transcriptase domain-containing protein n=1 Tax=Steinernema hermaphroditum TaxID=289476 RepID=A0AA39HGH0_9BILA|nr:hypothetical protein QR680_017417 [Steinernema hermaphroditum]